MPKLHLGVLVQPYRGSSKQVTGVTTGNVAQWLEDKYGVMAAYVRVHEKDTAKSFENSVGGALESLMMGKKVDPFGAATSEIETGFKLFLSSKEVERVGIPGVPTRAALMGHRSRKKRAHKRGPRRPSFIDTGLYMGSFKAWVSTNG
jgi:hypothetical protein